MPTITHSHAMVNIIDWHWPPPPSPSTSPSPYEHHPRAALFHPSQHHLIFILQAIFFLFHLTIGHNVLFALKILQPKPLLCFGLVWWSRILSALFSCIFLIDWKLLRWWFCAYSNKTHTHAHIFAFLRIFSGACSFVLEDKHIRLALKSAIEREMKRKKGIKPNEDFVEKFSSRNRAWPKSIRKICWNQ